MRRKTALMHVQLQILRFFASALNFAIFALAYQDYDFYDLMILKAVILRYNE